TNLYML
nr:Chain B, Putative metabolite transport protein YjhB [Escherichia coli K-12]